VRGSPDVQVMFKRSEGGERSRRRKGIARNMLRGERCCSGGGGGWDDRCCDGDSDRAEPVLGFAVAGRMLFDGAGDGSVSRVTVCRRRATGVGEDDDADANDEDVVTVVLVWALVEVEVLLLLVLGGAGEGETSMPKGVSSSFTLEEDAATLLVAGRTRG
jgi:hypothetical protein